MLPRNIYSFTAQNLILLNGSTVSIQVCWTANHQCSQQMVVETTRLLLCNFWMMILCSVFCGFLVFSWTLTSHYPAPASCPQGFTKHAPVMEVCEATMVFQVTCFTVEQRVPVEHLNWAEVECRSAKALNDQTYEQHTLDRGVSCQ